MKDTKLGDVISGRKYFSHYLQKTKQRNENCCTHLSEMTNRWSLFSRVHPSEDLGDDMKTVTISTHRHASSTSSVLQLPFPTANWTKKNFHFSASAAKKRVTPFAERPTEIVGEVFRTSAVFWSHEIPLLNIFEFLLSLAGQENTADMQTPSMIKCLFFSPRDRLSKWGAFSSYMYDAATPHSCQVVVFSWLIFRNIAFQVSLTSRHVFRYLNRADQSHVFGFSLPSAWRMNVNGKIGCRAYALV